MIRLPALLLAGLLLLPLAPASVEAKAISTAPQVHVVKQGDSLYEIGRLHGLSVNELKQLNGLHSSSLKIGQKLALTRAAAPPIPQAARHASPPKASAQKNTPSTGIYVVKRGDSLHTIARRHHLTVDQLKQFNALTGNQLRPGQRLHLSDSPDAVTATPARAAEGPAVDSHKVKKGDTLYSIARRHGMAVEDLKRINDLTSSRLKVGQRLVLASPEPDPSPLLLPGDANEDEVLDLATTSDGALEQAAFNYLSTPYRFGGSSRKGIDCSAFVQNVFRDVDVDLPRSAREQFRVGEEVDRGDLQPGDLLFFRTYARYPSHVGIYLGDGKMIHASSRSRRVVVTDIDFPYYRKRFIGAKRISLLDEDGGVGSNAPLDREDTTLSTPVETIVPTPSETAAPATEPASPMAAAVN